MPPKRRRDEDEDYVRDRQNRRIRLWDSQPAIDPNPPPESTSADKLDSEPILSANALWNLTSDERKKYRHKIWISRSKYWDGFPGAWEGVKVLGQGTYGIAGLFKYVGNQPQVPKQMVVKQSGSKYNIALRKEATILKELGWYGSPHILKMYRDYYEEGGTNVHPKWDPTPWIPTSKMDGDSTMEYEAQLEVSRIYLEYCANGDAQQFWRWSYDTPGGGTNVPEHQVWMLFKCMVKALLVLKNGSEDPNAPKKGREIVHMDIKHNNIFVGELDPTEHRHYPIIKLADFGMAQHLPTGNDSRDNFVTGASRAGAESFKSPEQIYSSYYHHIDTRMDLWTTASTVYTLATRKRINSRRVIRVTFRDRTFKTYGRHLWDEDRYSSSLKGTIWQCLAHMVDERPSLSELLRTINTALEILDHNPNDQTTLNTTPLVHDPDNIFNLPKPSALDWNLRFNYSFDEPVRTPIDAVEDNAWDKEDEDVEMVLDEDEELSLRVPRFNPVPHENDMDRQDAAVQLAPAPAPAPRADVVAEARATLGANADGRARRDPAALDKLAVMAAAAWNEYQNKGLGP